MSLEQTKTRKIKLLTERDGFHCHYCGCTLEENEITGFNPKGSSIDHAIAQDSGGTDDLENLVLACRQCNVNKKTKHYQEFRLGKETDLMLLFLMGEKS